MRLNTIILFLVFSAVLFFSILIFRLNQVEVFLDLLFFESQVKLGKIILISFLIGSFVTIILEAVYIFRRKKSDV